MITLCNDCGQYRAEKEPTPCPDCHPVRVEQAMCGNECGRPATVVTKQSEFIFCSPCYAGFELGRSFPKETVAVEDGNCNE